jgi:hypothetical protein
MVRWDKGTSRGNNSMTTETMFEVTAQNVADHVAIIRKQIGEDLIDFVLAESKITAQKGLLNHHRALASAHPLAGLWLDLENEVNRTKESGILSLSIPSLSLLNRLYFVVEAKKSEEWKGLLQKLSNESQFFSTLFEIETWKNYKSLGFDASTLPEKSEQGPDIEVKLGGDSVCVECKSLQDIPNEERNSWHEICARIIKICFSNKCWWRINIAFTDRISSGMAEKITSSISEKCKNRDVSPVTLEGKVRIEIKPILQSNMRMPEPLAIDNKGEFTWAEIEGQSDESGLVFVSGACLVAIVPYFDLSPEKKISNILKKASSQLPQGKPGILHIEIPFRDGEKIISILDNLCEKIHQKINRSHRRINAVVLSTKRINLNPRDPDDAINELHTIIPNDNAYHRLPEGFRIAGSSRGESREERDFLSLGAEGTVLGELKNVGPISAQIGRNLIFFCGADGKKQLKIWRDYRGDLRIEIVIAETGRRVIRNQAEHLQNLSTSKFGISWSRTNFSAVIEKQLLVFE